MYRIKTKAMVIPVRWTTELADYCDNPISYSLVTKNWQTLPDFINFYTLNNSMVIYTEDSSYSNLITGLQVTATIL